MYTNRSLPSWVSFTLWGVAAFLLILFNQFSRYIVPVPPPARIVGNSVILHPLGIVIVVVYLALLLFTLMQMARASGHLRQSGGMLFLVGLALAVPFATALLFRRSPGVIPPWLHFSANSLFLPMAAALIGAAAGRRFSHVNTVLAAAGFAAFFDLIVVTLGTVAIIRMNAPHVISAVSVGAASQGPGPALPPPISSVLIGPADVLFLSIFFSAIVKLGMSERRTFIVVYATLLLSLLGVESIPGLSVPALLPMGLAILIANMRHAAFTREEKFALLYGGVFAVVLAVGLVVGARAVLASRLPPPPAPGNTHSGSPAPGAPPNNASPAAQSP